MYEAPDLKLVVQLSPQSPLDAQMVVEVNVMVVLAHTHVVVGSTKVLLAFVLVIVKVVEGSYAGDLMMPDFGDLMMPVGGDRKVAFYQRLPLLVLCLQSQVLY